MSFKASLFVYAGLILAIVCIAYSINLEPSWILGIAALLVGLGIIGGFENTHQNDPR
jgi:hypothetical protein